ncbi:MAG TPA: response regulator [Vicinamibacterales bacterium]|nr:response regulator [Vicinamibacterales bacterium]
MSQTTMPDAAQSAPMVLVIEDHPDTRAMYVEFLSMRFRVEQAASAVDGLDLAQRQPPDIVVTDLSLPGMDGFALIERMRQDPVLHDVPAICLSGYGGHANEQRARSVGCQLLLQKPCLPDDLAAHVDGVLRAARGHR